ncbi:hypothetical protein PILCRDRAFT_811882 [Piloderma croceum F 1598]|uniref:Uncharacterized protein n=1 Tax=Piloderma croceum (strain F 1598) TaxID=765440 RepID=A0A0C3GHN6_PILCF|nr:hypothetical protein PILCRDRAFT_811882 [Piloderma croceum F 1598]
MSLEDLAEMMPHDFMNYYVMESKRLDDRYLGEGSMYVKSGDNVCKSRLHSGSAFISSRSSSRSMKW